MRTIEVGIPMNVLWVDVNADDFYADATESNYLDDIQHALYASGYDATVSFTVAATSAFYDENGDLITDDDYHHIRRIIDSVEVHYVSLETFITVTEFADREGIHPETLRRLLRNPARRKQVLPGAYHTQPNNPRRGEWRIPADCVYTRTYTKA